MNNDQINIELIKAISRRPQAIFAHTFIQKGSSFSRPVWLECEDGKIYVVKGRHAGRSIFNDQMIARLGRAMNAPVGVPADRKSTRLNSSHQLISYAVFC